MASNTKNRHDDTVLTHAGRKPFENKGIVNPPVYHASTILFPTLEVYNNPAAHTDVFYGRRGTPTTFAFADAVTELERAHGTVLTSCGLSAVTTAVLSVTEAGSHVLMTDSVYGPSRNFMSKFLSRFGVEVEYYDPTIGSEISSLIRDTTKVIFMEAPGSWTFEMQDIPAIITKAKKHNIVTIVDNTWAGGYFFKPLEHGADMSVQAATKYIVGHSDALMGTIACNEATYKKVDEAAYLLGNNVGPDDVYLAARGMRSMGTRLRQHQENGIKVANWLKSRPEVKQVLHPALPEDPGHEIWKRDFTGASGLFGFIMEQPSTNALANMMDHMDYFGMGFSWGGFESLLIPVDPRPIRTATNWEVEGQTMRIHIGLEDVDDLIADLEAGFERLKQA
ncbi:cystathionine beta-lyase [Curvivirga sp.]|uniref:cystathionine beta-lyase n=1 Tax=Curvivirga sp. TaxID=2856848 RepID=UPI003B591473